MEKPNDKYYWSLILEPDSLSVSIWTILQRRVQVVFQSKDFAYTNPDDLIKVTNEAMSEAANGLPDDQDEPDATVFGVSPSWVSEGAIKKEYLEDIRMLCTKLSLSPSGFVVLPEAIAHYIKFSEGAPLNGVILGINKSSIDLTLVKLGNISGTVTVGRSTSFVDDVIEGLSRFGSRDNLPTRFLLYGGDEDHLKELSQNLVAEDWNEKASSLKFLHVPKVEIFDYKKKAEAVSLAGASEIEEVEGLQKPLLEGQEGGDQNVVDPQTTVTPGDVGFVLGGDVSQMGSQPQSSSVPDESGTLPKKTGRRFSKIKFALPKLSFKLPRLSSPFGFGGGLKKYIVIFFSFVLIVGGIFAWIYLPKADVTLFVSTQTLREEVEVVLRGTIPADEKTVTVNGQKTASATGKKTVGDKARGQVTIRNGTAVEIEVESGTLLAGPNNLQFVLSETVEVAAASSPSTPGSETIEIEASEIGSEYNLSKGETFVVGNYPKSEVDAVVQEDLSGGSSREIVAVSESDLEDLEDNLISELKDQAASQLEQDLSSEQMLIRETIEVDDSSSDFNRQVGDEADSVSLEMELRLRALVVGRSELASYANSLLAEEVPSGFVLLDSQIKYEFENGDKSDEGWMFDLVITANLLPEIKPDQLSAEIAGKSPEAAQAYLGTVSGLTRSNIRISPQLPGPLLRVPFRSSQISVEVVAD